MENERSLRLLFVIVLILSGACSIENVFTNLIINGVTTHAMKPDLTQEEKEEEEEEEEEMQV